MTDGSLNSHGNPVMIAVGCHMTMTNLLVTVSVSKKGDPFKSKLSHKRIVLYLEQLRINEWRCKKHQVVYTRWRQLNEHVLLFLEHIYTKIYNILI